MFYLVLAMGLGALFRSEITAALVASVLLAWTVQNRIGVALLVVALTALACTRAQRREQLLRV